jgi:hypothetical protein
VRVLALLLLLAAAAPALADDDAAALLLADQTATPAAEPASDWRVYMEAAVRESRQQGSGAALHGTRLSLDVRLDKTFAPG